MWHEFQLLNALLFPTLGKNNVKGHLEIADKCLSFCQLGDCLLPLLDRGTIKKVDIACSHLCSSRSFCFTPVVKKRNSLSLCTEKFFVH